MRRVFRHGSQLAVVLIWLCGPGRAYSDQPIAGVNEFGKPNAPNLYMINPYATVPQAGFSSPSGWQGHAQDNCEDLTPYRCYHCKKWSRCLWTAPVDVHRCFEPEISLYEHWWFYYIAGQWSSDVGNGIVPERFDGADNERF